MRSLKTVFTGAMVFATLMANAAETSIRLRNHTISVRDPDRTPRGPQAANAAAPISGLFLIQFEGRFQPEWRDTLRARGVELVRYVPDNAFIARFRQAQSGAIKALPFVRWVGDFTPEDKIHPRLSKPRAGQANEEPAEVRVLLSPKATDAEITEATRPMQGISQTAIPGLGTISRGRIAPGRLNELAQSQSVLWIEPAPKMRLYDEVSSRIVAGDGSGHQTAMTDLGYDGSGVTVAVADSGLDSGEIDFMHPDIAGRVTALFAYGGLEDAADEHSHGTHCAGIIAGNGATGEIDESGFLYGVGAAPGASLIGQRLFDGRGAYYAPPTYETLTREATQAGADIGSNSWGDDTQGAYDLSAAQFDALVRDADLLTPGDQPYILEFSAGNAGANYQTVGSPAVGKNVIATGASQNNRFNLPIEEFTIYADGQDAMADFSSRGPCEDGRIKPDVVAPGTWIASLRSIYADDNNAWWPISDYYLYQGGTSQAGPQVSGAAAVFVQYYRETHGGTPSPALVKAALINSAVDMDDYSGTGPAPNMDEGWGRVDLTQIIGSPRNLVFIDQTNLLQSGQTNLQRVVVASSDEPLKVTLTYTDVPGFPGSPVALVNDLDLEVVAPDGHVYRGNRFDEGESIPNAPSGDNINNVEGVFLFAPVPGEYLIRVIARRVVEDALADTPVDDQDFALVISASIVPPGHGIVTFNRPAYTAPGLIRLALVDQDLAGQSTAAVSLRSTTETTGETVTLHASGVTGLFTANVATSTGPALPDGTLQVSHGDVIEAVYQDAVPPATRTFSVRADLISPVISNVEVVTRFGRTYVNFRTDEDAVSSVRYGTNVLSEVATNRYFDTLHELPITNIVANLNYEFIVIAEDAAGNRATNDNGGNRFAFTVVQPPLVLLVDGYNEDLFDIPPLSGYTDALDRLGVNYEVRDKAIDGSPTAAELEPYRCVIWRFPEFFLEGTVSATEVQAITNYLAGGGSLLVASMELLSRLQEDGFPNFARDWLQVQSFEPDLQVPELVGASGEPIGAGINTTMNYVEYEDPSGFKELLGITEDASDTILPTTNAAPVFYADPGGTAVSGIRAPKTGVDLPGRVVFLSTALDAIPLGMGIGNNRAGVLRNILDFLVPAEGNSAITLNSDVYSVPSLAIVEVEDHDLEGQGQTTVTFSSPSQPSGVAVTLFETVRRGLFRGSLALVPASGSSGGTELVVQSGETIRADYLDASVNMVKTVTAIIETSPPVISNVGSEPGYVEAFVWWDTSEPADALVQFSESPEGLSSTNYFPINFTAYDPNLDTYHELLLASLLPNQTYYFRVVSRDKAGNVAVDDNGGQFYTFTTQQPQTLPWNDDFEHGLGDWSVGNVEGSEADWTLGVPGAGSTAHSPATCWGSNLGGDRLGLAESVLVSPGIFVTGGNNVTLRYWQNYDFPPGDSEVEYGEVWLLTNATSASYIVLDTIGTIVGGASDSSAGWEQMEFDLTPYLGQVIYIAWHYFVFSGDDLARQGWLIDDVSIDAGYAGRGTVQITNNIAQAFCVLTGPVSRSGWGESLIVSNAPPGEYVLQFGAVPYYELPPPQTNFLQTSNLLVFHGNYVFADTNLNGMSDTWEQQYFGNVAANHSPNIDSDGDGVSDYGEFVSGTNPTNSASTLRVGVTSSTGDASQLTWRATAGRSYRIVGSSDLINWSPVTDWRLISRGGLQSQDLGVSGNTPPQFFRLEVRP